jgi:cyclase
MLKRRLVGVITVRRGWAVQSFGYRRWLPLGRPEVLAQNLDRWGVDEILVQVIDRSYGLDGPDLDLLWRLGSIGLSTPLIYGGGIASLSDAEQVVSGAADRVCVDALLHDNPDEVDRISRHLGAQAVIGAIPLSIMGDDVRWLDYRDRSESPIPSRVSDLFLSGIVSEALVIDWRNEGKPASFDETLINLFPIADVPLIVFGGLSDPVQLRRLLSSSRIVAAAIGNFFNYKEHAVQSYRSTLAGVALRPPIYRSMRAL